MNEVKTFGGYLEVPSEIPGKWRDEWKDIKGIEVDRSQKNFRCGDTETLVLIKGEEEGYYILNSSTDNLNSGERFFELFGEQLEEKAIEEFNKLTEE